jgi:hypothetical protein
VSKGCEGMVSKRTTAFFFSLLSITLDRRQEDEEELGSKNTYHAVLVKHRRVPSVLDIVNALRHQSQSQLSVHEQVVQQTPRGILAVAESRMRRASVESETQCLPFGNVVVGDGRVVCPRCGVAGAVGDGSHGLDAEDAFEGEVGLVSVRGILLVNGGWWMVDHFRRYVCFWKGMLTRESRQNRLLRSGLRE